MTAVHRMLTCALLAASAAGVVPPSTMTAVHRGILGCQTPFKCVTTHTVATPMPGQGEVLLRVGGSSVNPCDVDYVEYGVGCPGGKGTLGMDVAGTGKPPGADCAP